MPDLTRRQLLAAPAAVGSLQATRSPNVVLIVGDDLGYADIGCYGQRDILTPHSRPTSIPSLAAAAGSRRRTPDPPSAPRPAAV